MKTSCENDTCCDSASECCDTGAGECGSNECPVTGSCDCPVEGLAHMWVGSFGAAMKEAQKDILKAKIVKAWGPTMEQAADALLESMGTIWASKVAEVHAAQAKGAFKEKLAGIMFSEKKK